MSYIYVAEFHWILDKACLHRESWGLEGHQGVKVSQDLRDRLDHQDLQDPLASQEQWYVDSESVETLVSLC